MASETGIDAKKEGERERRRCRIRVRCTARRRRSRRSFFNGRSDDKERDGATSQLASRVDGFISNRCHLFIAILRFRMRSDRMGISNGGRASSVAWCAFFEWGNSRHGSHCECMTKKVVNPRPKSRVPEYHREEVEEWVCELMSKANEFKVLHLRHQVQLLQNMTSGKTETFLEEIISNKKKSSWL